jgi:starch-binding outer membrane protein, SusD/RagB family
MDTFVRGIRRQLVRVAVVVAATASLAVGGCTDRLLEAVDPDLINPGDVQNAAGAEGLRIGALGRLAEMTALADAGDDESTWFFGGLLTDEWKSGDTFQQRDETDQRLVQNTNSLLNSAIRDIHRARVQALQAIRALRAFKPEPVSNIAQMFFVKGFAELQAAQDLCNGLVFSDGSGDTEILGEPMSVVQAAELAAASFDSALAHASGTDALAASIRNAAAIGRARALVYASKNNLATAAALVANVPTTYRYLVTFLQASGDNEIWGLNNSARRYTVGDSVDATGVLRNHLPFVSARDPRVPTSQNDGNGTRQTRSFDSATPFFSQQIWPTRETDVAVVSGVEARLIEAEAQLETNPGAWLTIMNALRAPTGPGSGGVAGLAPLVDPGAPEARLRLHFREKAFWTFARGQRVGDLRRLIRQYLLPADQVFPASGDRFHKGGNYGDDVNLPVTQAEQNNPNFRGCTDRDA